MYSGTETRTAVRGYVHAQVAVCVVEQLCVRYGIGIKMFLRPPAISETGDGSFRRFTLIEFDIIKAHSFADKTLCRRVGRAWRGRLAAVGPLVLGKAVPKRGILKQA